LTTSNESSKKIKKTEVLYNLENSISKAVEFIHNAIKIDIAGDKEGPSIFIENNFYRVNLI
jgi:hypothetical protein